MSLNVTIDATNFKGDGDRIPEGRYRVAVETVELDKSKAGNPMINVWFRVVGGEFDGSTLKDRLVLTEKSLFRVVGFLNALGIQVPKKKVNVDFHKTLGKQMEVDVADGEPYNGRVKSEVRGYLRLAKSSAATTPDTSDDVADLDDVDEAEALATTTPEEHAPDVEREPAKKAEPVAAAAVADDEIDLDELDL